MMENLGKRPVIPCLSSQRDRFVGERPATPEVRVPRELHRLEREQACPAARVRRVVKLDRSLDRGEPLLVGLADHARIATVVRQRRSGGELRLGENGGDPGGLEQRLAVACVAGLALALAEPDQHLTALGAVGVAHQLDGVGEQLHGLGGSEAVERAFPGAQGVVGCLGLVDRDCCEAPVQRELREAIARVLAIELLERLGDTLVHPRTARGAEALIQRLVDERVGEAKLPDPVAGLGQQRGGNGCL